MLNLVILLCSLYYWAIDQIFQSKGSSTESRLTCSIFTSFHLSEFNCNHKRLLSAGEPKRPHAQWC